MGPGKVKLQLIDCEIDETKNGHYVNGDQEVWLKNGKLHREDGPALIWNNHVEEWYYEDVLHREDGPALTFPDGTTMWYKHGSKHREDGPAVIWGDSSCEWWHDNMEYRFSDWCDAVGLLEEQEAVLIMTYDTSDRYFQKSYVSQINMRKA